MAVKKKAKRKTAPCRACKGFTVPSRTVKKVRRNAKGQFAASRPARMSAR